MKMKQIIVELYKSKGEYNTIADKTIKKPNCQSAIREIRGG